MRLFAETRPLNVRRLNPQHLALRVLEALADGLGLNPAVSPHVSYCLRGAAEHPCGLYAGEQLVLHGVEGRPVLVGQPCGFQQLLHLRKVGGYGSEDVYQFLHVTPPCRRVQGRASLCAGRNRKHSLL